MQTTLVQEVWPLARDSRLAQAILVVAGTLLLAVSAKVQVPFWPVPMTMQSWAFHRGLVSCGRRVGLPSICQRCRSGLSDRPDRGLSFWVRAGDGCLWLASEPGMEPDHRETLGRDAGRRASDFHLGCFVARCCDRSRKGGGFWVDTVHSGGDI